MCSVLEEVSRHSFINNLCKFINEVDHMNQVVLIPARLSDCQSVEVSECSTMQDLHTLLNRLKHELVSSRLANSTEGPQRQQVPQLIQRSQSTSPTTTGPTIESCPKYASSCSDDDGFSSLTSYRQNSSSVNCSSSDDESMDSDSDFSDNSANESSPEFIVNSLRLHLQGIESILNRFSKYTDQVSEGYITAIS